LLSEGEENLTDKYEITQLARKHKKEETENLEAPGQFLRHYSPDIPAYLYRGEISMEGVTLEESVLLDFGGLHVDKKDTVKEYLDLSADADIFEAINKVYDYLRLAETNKQAKTVLMTDILYAME